MSGEDMQAVMTDYLLNDFLPKLFGGKAPTPDNIRTLKAALQRHKDSTTFVFRGHEIDTDEVMMAIEEWKLHKPIID